MSLKTNYERQNNLLLMYHPNPFANKENIIILRIRLHMSLTFWHRCQIFLTVGNNFLVSSDINICKRFTFPASPWHCMNSGVHARSMGGENPLKIHEIYEALTPNDSRSDIGSRQTWTSESAATKQAEDNKKCVPVHFMSVF